MKTANLNRMIKILENISNILLRDFVEIENLQNNYNAAAKFANSSYQKIVDKFLQEFGENSDIELLSGKNLNDHKNCKEFYIISPIEGMVNFSRALPNFSSFISYGQINDDGRKQILESSMILPIENQIFTSAKNSWLFYNNRIVKITNNNNLITAIENIKFSNLCQDQEIRISGSVSNDIAKFALGKIDQVIFSDKNLKNALKLYILESGGRVEKINDYFIAKR